MSHSVELKELTYDDIELVRQWRNQDHIRTCFLNSSLISEEQQSNWFAKYSETTNDLMFIILSTKLANKAVGTVALYNIDLTSGQAEFGRLMIGDAEARGLGIGFYATKQMCEYGFRVLNLKQIYLQVFQDNVIAKNIYSKVGFNVVKTELLDQKLVDLMVLEKQVLIND